MKRLLCLTLLYILFASPAWAVNYFIAPTGSNSNNGTSSATPWLTFAFAINAARASCGDTLFLEPGTYGDGTSTGKINIVGLTCSLGDELRIQASTARQSLIQDNGTGVAVKIENSDYITLQGLYVKSANNSSFTANSYPLYVLRGGNITIQNSVFANPNKYGNNTVVAIYYSDHVLFEDNELYDYHRHGVTLKWTANTVLRRVYCNSRIGSITGGYGTNLGGKGTGRGDSCVSIYPAKDSIVENVIAEGAMYLAEVNAEYTAGSGTYILPAAMETINDQILGSICIVCSYSNGIYPSSRRAGIGGTVQALTIRDVALVDWASASSGIRLGDCYGPCVIDHFTLLGTGTGVVGISLFNDPDGVAAASNTVAITNALVSNAGSFGLNVVPGEFTNWTANEIFATGNSTNFSPSSSPNLTNNSTSAHGMGTCKLWAPVGAAVKGAGTGGSDIAATILYRYVNGVLTNTPLWDPTTGEFPHGAATFAEPGFPDGINRVSGQSLFDVHTRLNVNSNGCNFPAGYGAGGGGGGPSTVVMGGNSVGQGTSSLNFSMTVAANQNELLFPIALWSDTGNVGSVTAASSSCGGDSFSLVKRQVTGPDTFRAVEVWRKQNPTAGSCTITATTTGNVNGILGRTIEFDASDGLNTAVSAATSGSQTSISVTAPTNESELVVSAIATSKSPTWTTGDDQTALADHTHTTKSLRLGVSTQNGSDGGVMSETMGATVLTAQVAVSIKASPEDPPSTATLEVDKFRIRQLYGTEADATALAGVNTQAEVTGTGAARVRVEIKGNTATTAPFGVQLFCRKNAESMTRALDTFDGKVFRLFGPNISMTIPTSLTATTNQLCSSSCVPGAFIRDQAASFVVPALTAGQKIELEWAIQLNAAAGDAIQCLPIRDDGSTLDTYTVTPTIVVVANHAASGF